MAGRALAVLQRPRRCVLAALPRPPPVASSRPCRHSSTHHAAAARDDLATMFLPMTAQPPRDATVPSHKLLTQAGYIHQLGAGLYGLGPLATRVVSKVSGVLRAELRRLGAQEMDLPCLMPRQLWERSGRWDAAGPELFRLEDRRRHQFCLGPTHEEAVTAYVATHLGSYRQLPIRLFQIGTKFRDEVRPRFGLLRGREFVMKDLYTFDRDAESAAATYEAVQGAYTAVLARLGVPHRVVEADTGMIGGSSSHEYHILAETGEDTILSCCACSYAANAEKASGDLGEGLAREVSQHHFRCADGRLGLAVVPRGHGLNPTKLAAELGVGVVPLKAAGSGDEAVALVVHHPTVAATLGLEGSPGAQVLRLDCTQAMAGDGCPVAGCDGRLEASRGIEIGHTFLLGRKYSEAMGATFLDEHGEARPCEMGCYGMGVSRLLAAVAEASHDGHGLVWPTSITPYSVCIASVTDEEGPVAASTALYDRLAASRLAGDVLLDTRPKRMRGKLEDLLALGIPWTVVVGKKHDPNRLEVRRRRDQSTASMTAAELVQAVLDDGATPPPP